MAGLQRNPRWIIFKACSLFAKLRNNLGALINKPFVKWHKKFEYPSTHATKQFHNRAWNAAIDFINTTENPPSNIAGRTKSQSKENYETNTHVLKCIVRAVLYCGQQSITFRRRNEGSLDGNENPGNFIAFLKVLGQNKKILQTHLHYLSMKNATYLPPDIPKELVNITGKNLILK